MVVAVSFTGGAQVVVRADDTFEAVTVQPAIADVADNIGMKDAVIAFI